MSLDPREEEDELICSSCKEPADGTDEETGEDITNKLETDTVFVCSDCGETVKAISLWEHQADEYHSAMEDRFDAMRDDMRGRHQ